jgi:hypothetical protein
MKIQYYTTFQHFVHFIAAAQAIRAFNMAFNRVVRKPIIQ